MHAPPSGPSAPNSTDGGAPKPFVDPSAKLAELSPRAAILGALFGVLFGAVTVYLALKVGLTVSASIPIAVLSIVVFRKLGRSTILENNIVQTIGSAGESIAAGVVFTLPALIFLNSPLEYHRIFLLALAGGVLGVLLMIPLRRALIVKEHATLRYPEGTACANILVAGEKGGALAGRVFAGLGVGLLYKALMSVAGLWKEKPGLASSRWFPGFSLSVDASPELLGVGYIIGFRAAATLVAGGILSWTVLIPFMRFVGAGVPGAIFPGKVPIAQMSPEQIWGSYIRYIGAGAVAAGGVINLARALPTIGASFRDSLRALKQGAGERAGALRTERDLPITIVFIGSGLLLVGLWALLQLDVNPGHALPNLVAALLIVVYGFFFVTVSSRVVGMIGSSNNPISGDTITTLMGTCLLFVLIGWTGHAWAAVALSIGAVVCIAAANAGATSQDLKTGFLVGATPRSQQIGLILGVVASVFVIGVTLKVMNRAYHSVEPVQTESGYRVPESARLDEPYSFRGQTYRVAYVDDAQEAGLPDGKYLIDEARRPVFRYVDGIGGATLPAPQARLMSLVIGGILTQKLPWTLVLLGIFIGIVMELCGVHALPFAVGVYLPLDTTTPVFFGGLMKLIADALTRARNARRGEARSAVPSEGGRESPPLKDEEASEGMLFSSGLIAGGALMGVAVAALIVGSGEWRPLANALEWLRSDGLRLEAPADTTLTLDGQPAHAGQLVPVRSHRIETPSRQLDGSVVTRSELVPAVPGAGGQWGAPYPTFTIEARAGEEHDRLVLPYDAEERARVVRFVPVDTWEQPIAIESLGVGVGQGVLEKWLVEEGAEVGYGDPLARVRVGDGSKGAIELRAPQAGRLARRTVPEGGAAEVRGTVGVLELRAPPISPKKPEAPIVRRRLVAEARPTSDALGMLFFLLLCGTLVASALPRARQRSS